MEKEDTLKTYIKEETIRRIFADVFDEPTIMALHKTAKKGYFDVLQFVISTGKEAHVYLATDKAGNPRAVKIYKIRTSDFKNMERYIKGDFRFKHSRRTKKDTVFTWAKKEFKNLSLARSAKASAPLPIYVSENILVMEFIGEDGLPAKTLKETRPEKKDIESYYMQTIDFIAQVFFEKELIHADLSEYNILVRGEKLVFIDMGQSVLSSHPNAKEFFERDVTNMANYFSKHGLDTSFEKMLSEIRSKKSKYKKPQKG